MTHNTKEARGEECIFTQTHVMRLQLGAFESQDTPLHDHAKIWFNGTKLDFFFSGYLPKTPFFGTQVGLKRLKTGQLTKRIHT
jgi:hypothetical protein